MGACIGALLSKLSRRASALALGLAAISAAIAPAAADMESPFCAMPPDPSAPWLPRTPAPDERAFPAPRPASDCQFYRPAWQRFLTATQPIDGSPAFLRYPSFPALFPSVDAGPKSSAPLRLFDIAQGGIGGQPGGELLDQNGRFIYYAIHVNPAFAQFLANQGLTTAPGVEKLDPALTLLGGDSDIATAQNTNVVEYKSAWMVVSSTHPPSNYFLTTAEIPHYVVKGDGLAQDIRGAPVYDKATVALIAMHVVFTLPGHPEMIWSTFEHVHADRDGRMLRDNAPAAPDNPSDKLSPDTILSQDSFPLYRAGTRLKDANQPLEIASIVKYWNASTQSFQMPDGAPIQTSVYRPYPGSKTDGSVANPGHDEDDEIVAINEHASQMFRQARENRWLAPGDRRENYRLVGAVWLDQPASGPKPSFKPDQFFRIDANQSTDDVDQPIAGEGRLGATAMESFTQSEDVAPNCLSCHDTNAINGQRKRIKPARLNVSHILSKFLNAPLAPTPPTASAAK